MNSVIISLIVTGVVLFFIAIPKLVPKHCIPDTGALSLSKLTGGLTGQLVSESEEDEKQYNDRIKQFRTCLLNVLPPTLDKQRNIAIYRDLPTFIRRCISAVSPTLLERDPAGPSGGFFESFKMGRLGEFKYFLRPNDDEGANKNNLNDCYFLTIGIGGDYNVEKEFKTKYPHCQIFGIEPMPDQFPHFEEYGTVINEAVGTEAGRTKLTVRKNTNYVEKEINVVPLPDLMDKYMKGVRFVQYSTLDIEGFEYNLMHGFLYGGAFDRSGVVICQIDVEFHDETWEIAEIIRFVPFLRSVFTQSPFLPVKSDKFLRHQKLTLINVENTGCRRAFGLDNIFA